MARQLFIDTSILERIKKELFSTDWALKTNSEFVDAVHESIAKEVEGKLCESLERETCSRLFYLGSFARGEACPDSDLDLLYIGDEEETAKVNQALRKVFRKYSIKYMPAKGVSFFNKEDPFGVISFHWAKPIFGGDVKSLDKIKEELNPSLIDEVKKAIVSDYENRGVRFGAYPGRLSYNFKNSRGGLKDTLQGCWQNLVDDKKIDQEILDQRSFFLKLRSYNHFLGSFDTLSLPSAQKYLDVFSHSTDREFFKEFYALAEKGNNYTLELFSKNQVEKPKGKAALDLKKLDFQRDLLGKSVPDFLKVKGLVQSPSYHTWTVGEHLIRCVAYMNELIKEESKSLNLTEDEEDILLWAALFHDIKKGEDVPHSIGGAEFAQEYGKVHNWSEEKKELVSWLVREHLTLSKFAFKDDPYDDEGIKKLYYRGVEKRRAVLLCLLTEADIKATNLSSWSSWKKQMLRSLLDRILKKESVEKENLIAEFSKNELALHLTNSLSPSEVTSVPYQILKEDLSKIQREDGYGFYLLDDRIWVRLYQEKDAKGLALNFISRIFSAGGFVHHAHFKTLSDGSVYNWLCIETGVSLSAFEKRFKAAQISKVKPIRFSRIRKSFSGSGSAVVSFRGKDQEGMLLSALYILGELDLDIRWGHAVTWGDEIEDVFGVYFESEPDWSILENHVSS